MRIPLMAVLMLLFTAVWAQESVTYWDIHRSYKEGLELMDREDYVNARDIFNDVLRQSGSITHPELKTIQVNSEYYRALAALKLQNPDAEHLMVGFLENHTGNARSNMAYFHLGEYYYQKKKYRDAVTYLEKVEPFELDREQQTQYKFQLGYSYFFRKEFDKAKRYFRELKGDPKYGTASSYYHGFIAFTQGEYNIALDDFKKVQGDNYFGKVVPFYITSIHFQRKEYREVIDYATPLLNDRSIRYYPEINQLVGKAWFELGEYDKALPLLLYYAESTRRMAKEDIFQLGYTQYKVGEYHEAIRNFEQLSRETDSLGQHALYLLGDSYLKTGDLRKARTAFNDAANLSHNAFVRENALFNYAKVSYELGFHNQAITATQTFIKDYPRSPNIQSARELLTDMFLGTRNFREAISTIESMEQKTPKINQAYQKVTYYYGVELYNNGQTDEAEANFDKSLKHPIDEAIHAQAYFWKGEIRLAKKDYGTAISNFRKFKSLHNTRMALPPASRPGTADYGIAYAYYYLEDWPNARRSFDDAMKGITNLGNSAEAGQISGRIYPDAVLRSGDVSYMLKDYNNAMKFYREVSEKRYPSTDYAMFQQGMLHGIQGDQKAKQRMLDQMVREFPKSFFFDDALYHLASAHVLERNNDEAIRVFNRLIKEEPNSPYVLQSLMKVALIYFNTRQNQQALDYYTRVAENYKGTPEAREAMAQIKQISIEMGDPDIYIKIAGAGVDEQDSLLFYTAERFYSENNFARAKQEFTTYLKRFPNGYFATLAHYFRGDIYYRDKEYQASLADYDAVLKAPNNQSYLEMAHLRSAKIHHFILKDYAAAIRHYEPVLRSTTNQRSQYEALQALMDLSYETGNLPKAEEYARQMLTNSQASPDDLINANFYIARSAYQRGAKNDAMASFTKVKELTTNIKGVMARYYIALIHFERKDYKLAEAQCDEVIRNFPGYEYWLVKSLVLISDIYVATDELYQAKATLESIVGSYTGDQELLEEARRKLREVERLMEAKSRIKGPEDDPFNQD
jgi:TolA-binding protein